MRRARSRSRAKSPSVAVAATPPRAPMNQIPMRGWGHARREGVGQGAPLGSEPAGIYDCPTGAPRPSSCAAVRSLCRTRQEQLLMFEHIQPAPRDPILGLTESFREDPNPKKINLSVGVYQDATGKTPILESVRKAGQLVLERQKSMSYLPIPGSPAYAAAVQQLMFGEGHEVEASGRAATSHTPGGTGACAWPPISSISKCPRRRSGSRSPPGRTIRKFSPPPACRRRAFPTSTRQTNSLAFDEALAAIQEDAGRRRHPAPRLLPQPDRHRPHAGRSGTSWPTRYIAAASCRSSTSPTKASPKASKKTRSA